ncbi:MAG: hypothetical protein ABMA64_17980 [Myxococcota bacterium]
MSPSWLTLELYAAGELGADERREVERALAADPVAREMWSVIERDRRPLPALPPRATRWTWTWAVGGLAAAAVIAGTLAGGARTKGGELGFELVADRDGVQVVSPSVVRVGDRVGARVTCDATAVEIDVVVTHGGEVGFPFARGPIRCGNAVPIPGAFSFDAPGPATVCLAAGELPPREVLGRTNVGVCVSLEVER